MVETSIQVSKYSMNICKDSSQVSIDYVIYFIHFIRTMTGNFSRRVFCARKSAEDSGEGLHSIQHFLCKDR